MGKSKKVFACKMMAPSTIILIALSLFPLMFVLYYSFTDYYFLDKGQCKFIGMDNFTKIIADTYFRQAIYNTVKFTIMAVLIEIIPKRRTTSGLFEYSRGLIKILSLKKSRSL